MDGITYNSITQFEIRKGRVWSEGGYVCVGGGFCLFMPDKEKLPILQFLTVFEFVTNFVTV